MTERGRLLAILQIPIYPREGVDTVEAVADFLLDHGVKVPVKCKECEHWDSEHGICNKHTEVNAVWMDADDYCSKGERRNVCNSGTA